MGGLLGRSDLGGEDVREEELGGRRDCEMGKRWPTFSAWSRQTATQPNVPVYTPTQVMYL